MSTHENKEHSRIALCSIKNTRMLIDYSMQFTNAVQKERILAEHFEQLPLVTPEPHSNNNIQLLEDWRKKEKSLFKTVADDVQILVSSMAIIIGKESYARHLWANETSNPDLYSAQKILQHVRNAMGHFVAQDTQVARPYWSIDKKDRRIYIIKELGIIFDATNLHQKTFHFSHLGGLSTFLAILKYLEKDLENKIKSFE